MIKVVSGTPDSAELAALIAGIASVPAPEQQRTSEWQRRARQGARDTSEAWRWRD